MSIEAPRKKDTAGVLSKAIRNKIVEHPGIKKDALIAFALKEVPSATEAKVLGTIGNLIYGERIRGEGKGAGRTFHLNTEVYQSARQPKVPPPKVNKPVGKLITGKEAAVLRGDPVLVDFGKGSAPLSRNQVLQESLASSPLKKQEVTKLATQEHVLANDLADHFLLSIAHDNTMFIEVGEILVMLDAQQTRELYTFMSRIRLDAFTYTEGFAKVRPGVSK